MTNEPQPAEKPEMSTLSLTPEDADLSKMEEACQPLLGLLHTVFRTLKHTNQPRLVTITAKVGDAYEYTITVVCRRIDTKEEKPDA